MRIELSTILRYYFYTSQYANLANLCNVCLFFNNQTIDAKVYQKIGISSN